MRSEPVLLAAACVLASAGLCLGCSSDETAATVTQPPQPEPEPIALEFLDQAPSRMTDMVEVDGRLAVFADLDGDGRPDIVQPTKTAARVFWNEGGAYELGAGVLTAPTEGYTNQVLAADFNGDAALDLLLLNTDGAPLQLWLNQGKRTFKAAAGALPSGAQSPLSAATFDLDGDADMDVVITFGATTAADGTQVSPRAMLLVNDGKGTFADETSKRIVAPGLEPWGVAAGDLDGDGAPDLFFSGDAGPHRLLLNDGHGAFRDAPPDAIPVYDQPHGRHPALGDFDGDGFLDVFVPSTTANAALLNDGHGRLTDETPFVLGGRPGTGYSAVAVDLDQDEAVDLVVANPSGPLVVARNDGTGRLFDYSGAILPTPASDSDSLSASAADIDGDGDLDLFVSRGALATPWLLVNRQSDVEGDGDHDGIPDDLDNCPDEPNADQANRDAHHFACAGGTACKAATGCSLAFYDGDQPYLLCTTPKTWADARAFCQAVGADLAVVDDADENAWIVEQGLTAPWLGLSDTATEGTFAWVDGSALGTTFWNDGEPNDSGGNEDCVGIFTSGDAAGKWNDFDCTSERAFLCKDTSSRSPADPGDACDVCPLVHDPAQNDSDHDGTGDACAAPE